MSGCASLFPPLLWAQRPEWVLLTVPLQDTQAVQIELQQDGAVLHLSFDTEEAATHTKTHYRCALPLFRRVAAEESSHAIRPRQIELKLKKVWTMVGGEESSGTAAPEAEDITWPRLTLETKKNRHIQVDWARWLDEDDDDLEEREMQELGDFGMSDDELMSSLSREDAGLKDAAANTFPGFGSAAGQTPIPDEEIMNATDDDDDMPPLEED